MYFVEFSQFSYEFRKMNYWCQVLKLLLKLQTQTALCKPLISNSNYIVQTPHIKLKLY